MMGIKATDIAYGRLRSPDLDKMEEFLTRFGLVRSAPELALLRSLKDAVDPAGIMNPGVVFAAGHGA